MTSVSSSGAAAVTATAKPWFLTFNPESKDAVIWKNGLRLKLRDGSSTGQVTAVSVLSESDKTLTLKGFSKDGSQRFRFHCHLCSFEKGSNNFTKELAPYLDDPYQFCMQLSKVTDRTIDNESDPRSPSSQEHSKSSSSQDHSKSSSSQEHSKSSTSQQQRKRAHAGGNEAQITVSKKKKKDNTQGAKSSDSIQEEIAEHQIGVFTVPVATLRDPPPYLRVREVKEWYVDYLAGMLMEEEGDHEDLTAPLLVIASASKPDFQQKNINSYTYEVIGGIQRFTAITRVNDRDGGRKITTRKCAIYGSGLSRSASLVLARQHNEFNQIQRTTSFPEIAACCRRLLFTHFAPEKEVDDEDTMPDIPRYNSQAYRLFKQECVTFLVSSQVSQPMVEQAIQMALLPAPIYNKMQSVFTLYEEGKLKGQKSRQMTGLTLQKALEGKLAPKLSQFKVFQGLQDEKKEELLDGLLASTLTFNEAEKASDERKNVNSIKEAFLKEVKVQSWAEAEAMIPKFARMDELKKFKVQKGKALPKRFMMFCDKARVAKQQTPHTQVPYTVKNGVVAVDLDQIQHVDFGEVDMVLIDVQNVFTKDQIECTIQGLSLSLQDSWTLVIYNITNGLESSDVDASCNLYGAKVSRVVTVCSAVRTEGDVDIGTSKEVVVAWWGTTTPPMGHILAEEQDMNTLVCHPQLENTMVSTQATGWIDYLLTHGGAKHVADIHSNSGEVTQICKDIGIECLSMQKDEESAQALVNILGLDDTEGLEEEQEDTGNREEDTGNREEDTEDILKELSAFEKVNVGGGMSTPMPRLTRSKGRPLKWSKTLGGAVVDSDTPIP